MKLIYYKFIISYKNNSVFYNLAMNLDSILSQNNRQKWKWFDFQGNHSAKRKIWILLTLKA